MACAGMKSIYGYENLPSFSFYGCALDFQDYSRSSFQFNTGGNVFDFRVSGVRILVSLTPDTYKVVVQGILGEEWSDRLAGMRLTKNHPEGEPPETTLIGHLRDQTQLNGVLNSLYDLHLPILSVEHIGREE